MLEGKYKLIRDKTLTELKQKYDKVLFKKIEKKEFPYYLKLRLKEETVKLLYADSKERLKGKIADILETLDYILAVEKITKSEITKIKNSRKKTKGGFDKQLLLISLEE